VALVRTDVSAELSASIIRVTRIAELGTLAAASNRPTLRRNFFAASPVKYDLEFYIPEDDILQGHRHENLKPYNFYSSIAPLLHCSIAKSINDMKKSVCFIIPGLRHEDVLAIGRIDPHILDFSSSWK
jgi:hypothetical protein